MLRPALAGGGSRVVLLAEEEPVLLVAVELRGHQRPDPAQALACEPDGQAAVALLLQELVRAVVPDLDRAGPVLAGRNLARKCRVLERVVLDVHGEMALARLERHALGHGPARERAVALEAEVVVEPPRVVALHDEDRIAGGPARLAERLGGRTFRPLALVLPEARHGLQHACATGFRARGLDRLHAGIKKHPLRSPTGGLAHTGPVFVPAPCLWTREHRTRG